MRPLSAAALLATWEAGQEQHPLDRALTVLAAASPPATRAELAALPLAERDRRLLRLRTATLGPTLAAYAECPGCGERLEFSLDSGPLLPSDAEEAPGGAWEAYGGGVRMRFRLPDSRDLAAAARCGDVAAARSVLVERCLLEVRGADGADPPGALPDEAVAALAARMDELSPGADVSLALSCPACGTAWQAPLDVPAFFWAELSVRARRVLREVDTLARAYHWAEAEILALTPARRRAYLELVGG